MADGFKETNDLVYEDYYVIKNIKRFNHSQAEALISYLSGIRHEIYGSSAQASWGSRIQRNPDDLDVGVNDVRKSAYYMLRILVKYRDGNQYQLRFKPEFGSASIVMWDSKTNQWNTIIDIQPLKEHQEQKPDSIRLKGKRTYPDPYVDQTTGLTIQSPNNQYLRKLNAVSNPNLAEKRKEKDSKDMVNLHRDFVDSEKLKRDANILRWDWRELHDISKRKKRYVDPTDVSELELGEQLEKIHNLPESTFGNPYDRPLTKKEKKKFVWTAVKNPDVPLDKINIGKDGNIRIRK
jgi:hypothetical protein